MAAFRQPPTQREPQHDSCKRTPAVDKREKPPHDHRREKEADEEQESVIDVDQESVVRREKEADKGHLPCVQPGFPLTQLKQPKTDLHVRNQTSHGLVASLQSPLVPHLSLTHATLLTACLSPCLSFPFTLSLSHTLSS